MGHGAFAVLVAHVVNHFWTTRLAEVDVDIRRAHSFRVQEAFENEVEGVGVNVGDFHHVCHQRTCCRATPRSHGNIVVFRPVDEVGGDEEVAGEAQLVNDAQLIVQAGAELLVIFGSLLAIAFCQPLVADFTQVFFTGGTIIRGEFRISFGGGGVQLDGGVAALGNYVRILVGIRVFREKLAHFFLAFEIHALGVAHAFGIHALVAGTHADENIVCIVVVCIQEVGIVGHHQRHIVLAGNTHQLRRHTAFLFQLVVLELHKDIVLTEDIHQFEQFFFGFFWLIAQQPFLHGTGNTTSQADKPLAEFAQGVVVDTRLVVEAIQVPAGNNLDKVLPADIVFTQQHQVAVFVAPRNLFLHIQRGGCHIHLAAQNGLEHGLLLVGVFLIPLQHSLVVLLHVHHEFNGCENIAMVGNGYRIHAQLNAFLNQILGVDHAVEQGIFCVNV